MKVRNMTRFQEKLTGSEFIIHHGSLFLLAVRIDDSATDDSCEEGEDSAQPVEEQADQIELHRHTATLVLDSINKAGLHLQRAMVLVTHILYCT